MTGLEASTLGLAILGAGLGIINTWQSLSRDRVKLRVVPKMAYSFFPGVESTTSLCIEVINRSAFPVTVSEVGLTLRETGKQLKLIPPKILDGGPYPRRLEPRSSFTAHFEPGAEKHPAFASVTSAYAKTDCGEMETGDSPALRSLVEESRARKS
jgi:hypothetical protein